MRTTARSLNPTFASLPTSDIAALSSAGDADINAMYAASRSLPLALASVLVVLARSRTGLLTVAFVMALVQAVDAVIGAIEHHTIKTLGPAFLALVTVAALIALWRCNRGDEAS